MVKIEGSGRSVQVFQQQADVTISQVNPVSNTLYTVLPMTANVRLILVSAKVTWAVTQPTPLAIVITIDGNTVILTKDNPVTDTWYWNDYIGAYGTDGVLEGDTTVLKARPFLLEGRSVKVEVRIPWATTQPTQLDCRVKYAKIP